MKPKCLGENSDTHSLSDIEVRIINAKIASEPLQQFGKSWWKNKISFRRDDNYEFQEFNFTKGL